VEGIPGELIFVLIFVAFSILEAVGRKKGAQRKKASGRSPSPRPSADREREGIPRAREPGVASGRSREGTRTGEPSSEGLIPREIWDEILGLARGTTEGEGEAKGGAPTTDMGGRELPPMEAETLEEIPPFEARSLEPLEPRAEPDRGLPDPAGTRRRGREVEVPPVPKSAVKGMPSLAAEEIGTGPGVAARPKRKPKGGRIRQEVFGDGSLEDLRKAIILKEVLDKPVGMRE